MAIGHECDIHGQPGDGTTYRPPNAWGVDEENVLNQAESAYFGRVRPSFSLPDPPPANVVGRELDYLRSLQKTLRPALLPAIRQEMHYFDHVFAETLGIVDVPDDDKRQTMKLLAIVGDTAKFWIIKEKARVNRPRPVQLAPDLDPPFCPGHPSFPSGHAGESFAKALALVEACDAYPRLHSAIVSAARNVAFHREVAGVHYPSDSECGVLLASQLLERLRQEPGYLVAVDRARKELEVLLGHPQRSTFSRVIG